MGNMSREEKLQKIRENEILLERLKQERNQTMREIMKLYENERNVKKKWGI